MYCFFVSNAIYSLPKTTLADACMDARHGTEGFGTAEQETLRVLVEPSRPEPLPNLLSGTVVLYLFKVRLPHFVA